MRLVFSLLIFVFPQIVLSQSLPVVDTLFPTPGTTMGTNYITARLYFEAPIQKGSSGNVQIIRTTDDAVMQSFSIDSSAVGISGRQLFFRSIYLPIGAYYIVIDSAAIKDSSGNVFPGIPQGGWSFSVNKILNVPIDNHALVITQTTPVNGALNINPGQLEIYWNEYLLKQYGNINIRNYYTDSIVKQIDVNSNLVNINANYSIIYITGGYPPGTYYIDIEPGTFINIPKTEFTGTKRSDWSFTVFGNDNYPLQIRSFTPPNKTFHFQRALGTAKMVFNKLLKSIVNIPLSVKQYDNGAVVGTANVTTTDSTAVFKFGTLPGNTHVYIDIPTGYFKDLNEYYNNGALPGKTNWSFTTAPADKSYVYDFSVCKLPFSQSGNMGVKAANSKGTKEWTCTADGYNSTTGALINGNIAGVPELNRDWLIFPNIDITGMEEPMLKFYSKTQYQGKPLKLLVSTNYTINADTAGAYKWTELNANFPAINSNTWKLSDSISLGAYKSRTVSLCFQYNSNETDGAAEWIVDSISLFNKPYDPAAITSSCIGADKSVSFTSNLTGATYKWQVNTGAGFTDLFNTSPYTGVPTNKLTINNFQSYLSGTEYRCLVNGTNLSNVFVLRINNYWTGAVNNVWENAANWSCNVVPDEYTDVIIESGNPIITSNVICRSMAVTQNAHVTVTTGYSLVVRN